MSKATKNPVAIVCCATEDEVDAARDMTASFKDKRVNLAIFDKDGRKTPVVDAQGKDHLKCVRFTTLHGEGVQAAAAPTSPKLERRPLKECRLTLITLQPTQNHKVLLRCPLIEKCTAVPCYQMDQTEIQQ